MTKPRELSKVFTTSTELATDTEMIVMVNSASAHAMSAAMAYTDSEISSFEALPSQSGNGGKYLSTDGSTTSWSTVDALPDQTGNDGKYLTTNGASASWATLDLNSAIVTASAAAVNFLVDGAPEALNTLNELAEALDDNANILDTFLTNSSASSTYYLKSEAEKSLLRWSKVYSGSATTISGLDDYANQLEYTPSYINLYINGILQDRSNYTASSGSTVVLDQAVLTSDVVEILSYNTYTVVNDSYTKAESDNKYLAFTSASSNYLTQANAASTYLTQSSAANTYLTQYNASIQYEKLIPYSSSTPSSPVTGDMWVDSTTTPPALKVYNGSSWVQLGAAVDDSQAIIASRVFG